MSSNTTGDQMDISDPKYANPGTDAEARAKAFVHDWLVENSQEIACSRSLFEQALAEAFRQHAFAVRGVES